MGRKPTLPYMSRVVVVGGGVIGCAVAERLSRHGHTVTLLERDQLGSKASGAAAGELSPSRLAAGPWTREVASYAAVDVDVRPQRGQLAALDPGPVMLRRSVFWSSGYLVPKADGSIIAGGTEEDAGFDARPT